MENNFFLLHISHKLGQIGRLNANFRKVSLAASLKKFIQKAVYLPYLPYFELANTAAIAQAVASYFDQISPARPEKPDRRKGDRRAHENNLLDLLF